MAKLKYAVHAYAWTGSWSNKMLGLIDRATDLGFDYIEIPLMEIELIDPQGIRERLEKVGAGVVTSTACSKENDITADEEETRARGVEYLKKCVKATAEMGAKIFSGVTYSAIGRRIDGMPDEGYWEKSARGLKQVARFAQELGVTVGIEPINRYETFLINTCDQGLKLKDMIDEPNIAIHLDAYHMNIEEDDFYEPTKRAAPHLCHFHLSESHRGIPGTGTVDWGAIYQALSEAKYTGVVGLESFVEVSEAMRAATCIWRPLAPSSDELLSEGLKYLKGLEARYYGVHWRTRKGWKKN
ncbi:sugar phosphate isomerase/epimerase [Acidobacteria bacterium AH-259-O06]|nr:sugar phosphate isomerase/epimerase [Acidobacteria bacterium AH-259-O06]